MPRRKNYRPIQFPIKVIGWLNIWDVEKPPLTHLTDQPAFQPFFCVLRQDLKNFICYKSEEVAEDIPGLVNIPVMRLDEGKQQFDRRWGYEALEKIRENSIQHFLTVSTERLCKNKMEESLNESLPDLTHFYDSGLFPKQQHLLKKFTNISYEKLVGEKEVWQGSVPIVSWSAEEDENPAIMDTTISTPSRFTNFLIRKGLKTNLKRVKSSTKLDRKSVQAPESDNTFVGTLKRSMSLGRLTRERACSKCPDVNTHKVHEHQQFPCSCVMQTPATKNTWSVISSRLKIAHSHDSLLSTHSPLYSVDLTTPEMEIRSLHPSILKEEHCFQVSTMNGNKYISCRTAEEHNKWVQSLRRTVNSQLENSRRSESSLKIWVVEAKNVPAKKYYFCEICLDKNLYARTSVKSKGDMLFWGEQFEFNNLPTVEYLYVNMYREADKKKKKDNNTLVGYAKIAIADVSNRQYVEKWFNMSSGTVGKNGKESKTDLPLIRLKVQHQTVQILPVELYKELTQYISTNYVWLCDMLEPHVNIRDKEDLATTLIKIMQKLDKSKVFLSEVVMAEVLRLDNCHLTFRGNSIATKSMEAHMKLVGEKYLSDTLADFVRTIIKSEDNCEVDPTKVTIPTMIAHHQTNLRMYCDMAWTKINTSSSFFPSELRSVFTSFRDKCEAENRADLGDNLISASIFLRFLCPAIMSPSLFHLTQEFPSEKAARNLTLIAKTLQTLANFSKFGGKEEYMTFMNDFVEAEWSNMKLFLQTISSPDQNDNYTEFDGYIDLGKEMSVLYTLLTDVLEKTPEDTVNKLQNLPKMLSQITIHLKDTNVTQHQWDNRKSLHYDNLVNIQAHIDKTSPTELLKDMLNQCGDSSDKLAMFSNGVIHNGSHQGTCNSTEFTNINSKEEVVSSMTVQENSEVSNVSVTLQSKVTESHVNKCWNQIVNAAEIVNGNYIDPILYIDDDGNHSATEQSAIDANGTGSQMSISQMSTLASSGYHSFGYSQCNSPVDIAGQESNHNTEPSPNNNTYSHSTPLSFSNPMYRLHHRGVSSHLKSTSPIVQASSNSSLSSEEAVTLECFNLVQGESSEKLQTGDNVLKVKPRFSKSSSSPSMSENIWPPHSAFSKDTYSVNCVKKDYVPTHSQSNNNVHMLNSDNNGRPRHSYSNCNVSISNRCKDFNSVQNTTCQNSNAKYPLGTCASRQAMKCNVTSAPCTVSSYTLYNNTLGSTPRRGQSGHEISNSADYLYTTQQHYAEATQRTSTDAVQPHWNGSPYCDKSLWPSPRGQLSSDDTSLLRRLSAQNAVHMGIRSVQRRIQEQEQTRQEYESEVGVLKQQLNEAQQRLKMAEERLKEHESEKHAISSEWQTRLEESEERMRKQQAEKDDQMKNIIQRLLHVEEELRSEQEQMQKTVKEKQKVIKSQEQHIKSLDIANNKLIVSLSQLQEHYNITTKNGITGPTARQITTDLLPFKTSSC